MKVLIDNGHGKYTGGELLPGQPGRCGLPALRSRQTMRDGHHG